MTNEELNKAVEILKAISSDIAKNGGSIVIGITNGVQNESIAYGNVPLLLASTIRVQHHIIKQDSQQQKNEKTI